MSTKDLVIYVTDDLTEYYKDLSDKECVINLSYEEIKEILMPKFKVKDQQSVIL